MKRTLDEWLRWQEALHPKAIELGLDRVSSVAARLGLPDTRIVTLTVGGTNGKGSSAHLAAGIYRAAGYRVGLYTSPHLLHYRERVRIDGEYASDDALCRAFAAIDVQRGETPLTYFEFGTLAALWLFREAGVDVQVLEVGLGGRLDAVNIVDADAALVTSIGLDHLDWLGPDRDAVGREKAGIFRADRPAIIAEPKPPAGLLDAVQNIGAKVQRTPQDFRVDVHPDGFDWAGPTREIRGLPRPGLAGAAQLRNAAGVIAAIESLQSRLPVPISALRQALPALSVPGRCERRGRFVFDVAHNREAAVVLADFLAQEPVKPTIIVIGMLADKPHADVICALSKQADAWVFIDLPGPRGTPAKALATHVPVQSEAHCCDNMGDALAKARSLAGAQGRIVVTGSFLTVAAAQTDE